MKSNQTRRKFLRTSALGLGGLALAASGMSCGGRRATHPPNFVLIFVDDMGYGDMTLTGHPTIVTPHLDRMADEGVMMTQFYVAASVCSPSRAALLTGRYQIRNGVVRVLFPRDNYGIPESEITLGEALKEQGYATACIGKWHLGHLPQFLPTRHGFDYYYGIPYSNDMNYEPRGEPPIPLMRNEKIIEQPAVQDTLTKRYTREAVQFIKEHQSEPFFLYLPHTMPHVPLYASEEFRGTSKRGLYGDVIQEIDWSVGQILDTLEALNLDQNTLVIFTSDNGPWKSRGERGGSAGPFRGGKITNWDGGIREPFLAWYPGTLPVNTVSTEVACSMDIFPTFLKLAGGAVPDDRPMDGQDLMPALLGKSEGRTDPLFFYYRDELTAVRKGPYKMHIQEFTSEARFHPLEEPLLFNVELDPGERRNIAAEYPEKVSELMQAVIRHNEEIQRRGENRELIENLFPGKYKQDTDAS